MTPRPIDPLKAQAGDRVRWSFEMGSGTVTVEGVLAKPFVKNEKLDGYLASITGWDEEQSFDFVVPFRVKMELLSRPIPPYVVRIKKIDDRPVVERAEVTTRRTKSWLRPQAASVRLPSKVIPAGRIIFSTLDVTENAYDDASISETSNTVRPNNRIVLTLQILVDKIEQD